MEPSSIDETQWLFVGDSIALSTIPQSILLGLIVVIISWCFYIRQNRSNGNIPPEACTRLASSFASIPPTGTILPPNECEESKKWKIESLWIYPIKSCRGIELKSSVVTGIGLEYDRRFALARYEKSSKPNESEKWSWNFMTQRRFPKMALIRTEIWLPDPSSPSYTADHENVNSGGILIMSFPGGKNGAEVFVQLPLDPTETQIRHDGLVTQRMTIWKDNPEALIMASTESNTIWIKQLQSYLGLTMPMALFRVSDPTARQLFRNAPRKEELGYQPSVGFQDAYPLHILNVASVQDVASKYDNGSNPLTFRNFRPNIVVSGGEAYAEDAWKFIQIGLERYHVSCRTVRCLLPNVNPMTGERAPDEPNKTLKRFRNVDEGDRRNACLGMQMVPAVQDKRGIHVRDEITILTTGAHKYVKM